MNPVIEQAVTFPNPLSVSSPLSSLKVLEWAKEVGNSFSQIRLYFFLGFLAHPLPDHFQTSSLMSLFTAPPRLSPLDTSSQLKNYLALKISISQKLGQTGELPKIGRDKKEWSSLRRSSDIVISNLNCQMQLLEWQWIIWTEQMAGLCRTNLCYLPPPQGNLEILVYC